MSAAYADGCNWRGSPTRTETDPKGKLLSIPKGPQVEFVVLHSVIGGMPCNFATRVLNTGTSAGWGNDARSVRCCYNDAVGSTGVATNRARLPAWRAAVHLGAKTPEFMCKQSTCGLIVRVWVRPVLALGFRQRDGRCRAYRVGVPDPSPRRPVMRR